MHRRWKPDAKADRSASVPACNLFNQKPCEGKRDAGAPITLQSRPKPLAVFDRGEEGLDHFRIEVIAVGAVQLVQPESIPRVVCIAPQVTHVFHEDEHLGELGLCKVRLLRDLAQYRRARFRMVLESINQRVALSRSEAYSRIRD